MQSTADLALKFSARSTFLRSTLKKNILTRKKQKRERKDWGKNREARVDTTKNLTQDNPCVPLCVVDFI